MMHLNIISLTSSSHSADKYTFPNSVAIFLCVFRWWKKSGNPALLQLESMLTVNTKFILNVSFLSLIAWQRGYYVRRLYDGGLVSPD